MSDLEFHVLLALGEGPSHGYAIGKAVEDQSNGRLDPTTGALYQVLRRLSDEDLIAAVPTPKDTDPRRRYFSLTPQGRRAAAAEAARLDALVRMARKRRLFPQRA
jgi:DNA-binding PadR family transcriptional regulator